MKSFKLILTFTLLAGISIFWFTPTASGQRIVNCKCDVDAAGNCLPCPKAEEDQSAPPVPRDDPERQIVCPCGYDPDGTCSPCNYQNKENGN